MAGVRLAKYLAARTPLSRREAEKAIFSGRVIVDHAVVMTPAFFVFSHSIVKLDGAVVSSPMSLPRLWCYHKPPGFLVTTKDPWDRKTIFSHLHDLEKSHHRIIYVGRLDMASEGLLLLTTSSALASFLEHPQQAFIRQYHVVVTSPWSSEDTRKKLHDIERGMVVDGTRYQPCVIKILTSQPLCLHISLQEGKKREIRVLLQSIGIKVLRLTRIAYGPFTLGNLAPRAYKAVPHALIQPLVAQARTKALLPS